MPQSPAEQQGNKVHGPARASVWLRRPSPRTMMTIMVYLSVDHVGGYVCACAVLVQFLCSACNGQSVEDGRRGCLVSKIRTAQVHPKRTHQMKASRHGRSASIAFVIKIFSMVDVLPWLTDCGSSGGTTCGVGVEANLAREVSHLSRKEQGQKSTLQGSV